MKALPVKDRVVVIREEAKEQTEGGIFIPDMAQKSMDMGYINAVGPDSSFKPGEKVMFGLFAGTEFDLNGVKLLLLRDDEILARIQEDAK